MACLSRGGGSSLTYRCPRMYLSLGMRVPGRRLTCRYRESRGGPTGGRAGRSVFSCLRRREEVGIELMCIRNSSSFLLRSHDLDGCTKYVRIVANFFFSRRQSRQVGSGKPAKIHRLLELSTLNGRYAFRRRLFNGLATASLVLPLPLSSSPWLVTRNTRCGQASNLG